MGSNPTLSAILPSKTTRLSSSSVVPFMAGQLAVPDDFDRMGSARIERLFGDDP